MHVTTRRERGRLLPAAGLPPAQAVLARLFLAHPLVRRRDASWQQLVSPRCPCPCPRHSRASMPPTSACPIITVDAAVTFRFTFTVAVAVAVAAASTSARALDVNPAVSAGIVVRPLRVRPGPHDRKRGTYRRPGAYNRRSLDASTRAHRKKCFRTWKKQWGTRQRSGGARVECAHVVTRRRRECGTQTSSCGGGGGVRSHHGAAIHERHLEVRVPYADAPRGRGVRRTLAAPPRGQRPATVYPGVVSVAPYMIPVISYPPSSGKLPRETLHGKSSKENTSRKTVHRKASAEKPPRESLPGQGTPLGSQASRSQLVHPSTLHHPHMFVYEQLLGHKAIVEHTMTR